MEFGVQGLGRKGLVRVRLLDIFAFHLSQSDIIRLDIGSLEIRD